MIEWQEEKLREKLREKVLRKESQEEREEDVKLIDNSQNVKLHFFYFIF